jgi:hypothetical protein
MELPRSSLWGVAAIAIHNERRGFSNRERATSPIELDDWVRVNDLLVVGLTTGRNGAARE